VREMTNAKDAIVNIFVQGYKYPLRGYAGGKAGTGNWFVVNPGKSDEIFVDSFLDRSPSPSGQVVLARSGGGGGWGDPFDRDPQMVLEDVLDEYISIECAEKNYGVVIDRESMKVDEEKTRRCRGKKD
jgi:N-methylhydantoinase B